MKKTILTALIVISSIGLFAQPLPPAYHGETTDQPGPPAAPFDGGLSILLIMGAAFGYKKINNLKKTFAEVK